ncbi:MAG: hypothetical protein DBX55_02910 [Verrucomicrobia bacterium]|nr:MAG: hypothetical protein DBX55_02910 [Verrucomicrobiota bacterium]
MRNAGYRRDAPPQFRRSRRAKLKDKINAAAKSDKAGTNRQKLGRNAHLPQNLSHAKINRNDEPAKPFQFPCKAPAARSKPIGASRGAQAFNLFALAQTSIRKLKHIRTLTTTINLKE